MSRPLMRVQIPVDLLASLLTSVNTLFSFDLEGVPEGAKVVGASYDDGRRCFYVTYEWHEFDHVRSNAPIPLTELIVHGYRREEVR